MNHVCLLCCSCNLIVECRDKVHYTLMEVREMTKNYIHEIGESGSGTVYYGQLQTGQDVAVKVWAQGFHRASAVFQIVRSPTALSNSILSIWSGVTT